MDTNSALYWLPRIEHLAIPKTRFVAYDHARWLEAAESDDESYRAVIKATLAEIKAVAEEIGYPVFLRTDQASAKHNGPEGYLLRSEDDILRVVWNTVEDNEMKLWMSPEQPQAFMLREFIDLNAPFTAFGGHPIAREWRYFVKGCSVLCRHFLWPQGAILFLSDAPINWKQNLRRLRMSMPRLAPDAISAALSCSDHDFWSVDFAQDRAGKYWLIDMAKGENSWHPDCAFNPNPKKK